MTFECLVIVRSCRGYCLGLVKQASKPGLSRGIMPAYLSLGVCCNRRLDMKIFLSSSCEGVPCAQIETNLLGTKYELVFNSTVQPFAQHQATHSHTPLLTYDKLSSMHSMRSASCDFDVPVVDLPATSHPHCSSATPLPAEQADLERSWPVSAAEPRCILGCIAETHFDDTQSSLHASTSSPPSFLSSFRSARQGRPEEPLPLPSATLADAPDQEQRSGANHPPSPPASPASPSFLARCQSAKDSFIASRSSSSVSFSPSTPSNSKSPSTSSFPGSLPGSGSLFSGSCDSPTCSCHMVPKSVGGIQYKTRLRGFMRPRRYESYSVTIVCMIVCITQDPMVYSCDPRKVILMTNNSITNDETHD